MKNNFLAIICCLIVLLSCYLVILAPSVVKGLPTVSAQDFGLEETVKQTPIARTSPAEFVGTIIKYVIGILGVILIALIIYGGVIYATSAGNEDRITAGKNILTYAIIGVLIVFLAFALTDYVLKTIITAGTITNETTTATNETTTATNETTNGGGIRTIPDNRRTCARRGEKCSKGARSLLPFVGHNCCKGYECSSNWRGTCEIPKYK